MNSADLFHVETVESADAPAVMEAAGTEDESWCSYVIANRRSRVVGRYRGTLAQTRRNAEQLARSINERAQGTRSAWAPRAQVQKKARRVRKTASR